MTPDALIMIISHEMLLLLLLCWRREQLNSLLTQRGVSRVSRPAYLSACKPYVVAQNVALGAKGPRPRPAAGERKQDAGMADHGMQHSKVRTTG